jgi:hypothetical protein
MANVTKVIQLPNPRVIVPSVTRWGVSELRFMPIAERAQVSLVAVDAAGAQIAGGASVAFAIDGADYRALFSAQLAGSLVGLINSVGQQRGLFEVGATVVDAE